MAEDHLKRSASFGSTRRDDPSFEEDPLIELARIVAEDGGFRRHRVPELRPARNEPGRREALSREESIASQLEAELLQSWDLEEGGADQPPQRPVTDVRAPAGAGLSEPDHVPLRPAAGGEHRPPTGFPEVVIEDSRPAHAAQGFESEARRETERPLRKEMSEPFEEELSALFFDAEASQAVDAAYGPAEDGDTTVGVGDYEEAYGDGYSAEVHDFEAMHASGAEPDELFGEEDADELTVSREPARPRRARTGLIAAAGVLGVVMVGGGVAALVGGVGSETEAGPPPVIRAEAGPAKVEPDETAEARGGDSAGQAVYDRVAGRAPKDDEKLVDRAEEPRQVSRVVLPQMAGGSQPEEASVAEADERLAGTAAEAQPREGASEERIAGSISSETARTQNGPRLDPVGPRRVRTVTVRPDGSIASTPEPVRLAEASPSQNQATEFDAADAPDPVAVRTVRIAGDGVGPSRALQDQPAETHPGSGAAPQTLTPAAEGPQLDAAARHDVGEAGAADVTETAEAAAPNEEQVAMLPRARPAEVPAAFLRPAATGRSEPRPSEPRQAAAPRGGQPVDLLAAGPAAPRSQAQPQPAQQAARPPSPSASTPYAVQLSAQRSEDQARATFASLRSRYQSILGSRQPQIERADLGDRGIYYRVRVGAGSQAEATQLCDQLKAAGGSCFVTR